MSSVLAPISWRFTCPRCGGFAYGTSQQRGEEPIGHCHSNLCPGFSWPRSDDWKHFRLLVQIPEDVGGARLANDAAAVRVLFVPADEQKQLEQAEEQMFFWAGRMRELGVT